MNHGSNYRGSPVKPPIKGWILTLQTTRSSSLRSTFYTSHLSVTHFASRSFVLDSFPKLVHVGSKGKDPNERTRERGVNGNVRVTFRHGSPFMKDMMINRVTIRDGRRIKGCRKSESRDEGNRHGGWVSDDRVCCQGNGNLKVKFGSISR